MPVGIETVSRRRSSGFQFKWVPDPEVFADALDDMAARLADRTMPLMVASQEARIDMVEHFTSETDPSGSPWQQWSGSQYVTASGQQRQFRGEGGYGGRYADYALGYPNVGILRQDEDLFHSATSESRFRISHDSVYYSSDNLPSAGMAHQDGAPHRRTRSGSPNPLPKREFIGLSVEASASIQQTFGEWFDASTHIFINSKGRAQRRWRGPEGGTRSSLGTFLPRG
jgi:hypothetical protein